MCEPPHPGRVSLRSKTESLDAILIHRRLWEVKTMERPEAIDRDDSDPFAWLRVTRMPIADRRRTLVRSHCACGWLQIAAPYEMLGMMREHYASHWQVRGETPQMTMEEATEVREPVSHLTVTRAPGEAGE